MERLYLVLSTFETKEEAQQLGRVLVEQGLAACSQVSGPISSSYLWNGLVEEATEYKLTLKVCADKLEKLKIMLEQQHSYDTPMIIVLKTDDVNQSYWDWACENGEQNEWR